MVDRCCGAMMAHSTTREEILSLISPEDSQDFGDWPETPLIMRDAGTGTFTLNRTVIYYCPWCGAGLPPVAERPEPPDPIIISFNADGTVDATVGGQSVDYKTLISDYTNAMSLDDDGQTRLPRRDEDLSGEEK